MFVATKFQAPPARAEHVVRTRCLRLVTGPVTAQHLLVSAPAGAGKSTFVAQWAASFERAAWVSLADEDGDPGQFWSAFIAGLGTVAPGVGVDTVAPLIAGADVTGELVRLVDELVALAGDTAVVLDDLHLIDDVECLTQLEWLLEHAPANFHVGLCSRADPPLPLHRLIAHGRLAVVRGAELLFDDAEADEFLRRRLGFELDRASVATIVARTEGWAAGLYLTAIAMRNGAAATSIPTGGDRRVRSYLDAEVLDAVDAERLEFLERVSLLPKFSAEMCDRVLGRSDSARMIAVLESRNLFVIPLDRSGTWFRLHHLFAEFMRERLSPAERARVYARAAEWHLDHDEVADAIIALAHAGRPEAAAELVAAHHARYINLSRFGATVARWLDLLPAELVARSPPLCLSRAWIAGVSGRTDEMEDWVARAELGGYEGTLPDGCVSVQAEAQLIRACFKFADLGEVLRLAREVASIDRPESSWWPLSHFVSGFCEYLTSGPTDSAIESLTDAERAAVGPGHAVVAVAAPSLLAAAHAERHREADALAAIQRASEARNAFGVQRVPQAAISWWSTARALLLLGRLSAAEHDAEAGVAATAVLTPEHDATMVVPPCLIHLARVRILQGRDVEARRLLADARRRLTFAPDPARLAAWLDEAERAAAPALAGIDGVDELSERELAVLRLLADALAIREIAAALSVSPNTVKSQTSSIYRKLGTSSRADAVARARELGILTLD
jgi:LuxR family maltose regulon positive regulatory protein